ncbi:cytidylate kinase [Methylopila jiangsuensis]|uniref:Cytidylate kinase n=1 Tax=Methylopila jiangsuensis TaxID=586230 RepID=A0A9W6JDT3_9HYPH|nr:(d)CMP kinase [Methylopila jiangsuensis]MDR6285964.1 cytidylate kinase [Methylopila jiangsuensis]GLK75721.1 cytidylate kinase [Methylopila jiangsuensis]
MIIAIDGPAASGKGTLARRIAAAYGLPHLDSGLLYRAVAWSLIARGVALESADEAEAAARGLDAAALGDPALRSEAAGAGASVVSAYPPVRAALLDFQRQFAATPPGAVIDGRDIGTVICPQAEVKIFVTASPEERARRRTRELAGRGEAVDEAAILADIRARDERDMNRTAAPLKPAADAALLDTTELDADAAFAAATAIVEARALKTV